MKADSDVQAELIGGKFDGYQIPYSPKFSQYTYMSATGDRIVLIIRGKQCSVSLFEGRVHFYQKEISTKFNYLGTEGMSR